VASQRGGLTLSRRPVAWIFCRCIGILLLSGMAGATLVRLAPGFGIEEQMLDTRLTEDSRRALSERHAGERNPVAFYIRFMAGILHGDAGTSTVYGRPVGSLIRERAARTIIDVGEGLAAGWCAALLIALAVVFSRRTAAVLPAFAVSASLLSMPSAVVAMICLLTGLAPAFATAAVVFPRIFPHAYEQFEGWFGSSACAHGARQRNFRIAIAVVLCRPFGGNASAGAGWSFRYPCLRSVDPHRGPVRTPQVWDSLHGEQP